MVFSSVLFLFAFLPLVLLLYFLLPRSLRNLVLFLSSLVFYAWGEPVYIVLMLLSSLLDYTCGRFLDYFQRTEREKRRKWVLLASMVGNLSLLGFFKYADFLVGTVNSLFGLSIPLLHLPLPIGISFYTFQTMSYTIDLYRGDIQVQKNPISFAAYVSMFPQLIAGPIVRYRTVADQINHRRETPDQFADGIRIFTAGLAKKVLLANNIGLLWDRIKDMPPGELPVLTAWLGIIAFGFQIYFDFSGYSDMAIGLGRMFGFSFPVNFDYPYISRSITEFWRRWHITLGTWFREYVYIPLGGNRVGRLAFLRNLLVVWFLTGLWHGSSWNFVLWGLYYGVILVLEKFWLLRWLEKIPVLFRHLYVLLLVLIGWVLFSFERMGDVAAYLGAMTGLARTPLLDGATLYLLANFSLLLIVAAVAATPLPARLYSGYIRKSNAGTVVALAVLILCCVFLVDATYNPFLYFRF